jgi:macrolide-specific efflux system membrane fusion protein
MRGKWLLLAGVAVLLAAAAGALSVWMRGRPRQAPATRPQPIAAAAVTGNEITLQGRIEARNLISIACPVDGIVEQMFVEVGQEVSEGQLLARIKSGKLESAREAAEAAAGQAQTKVTNLEGQIVEARLEYSRADAELTRARIEQDRAGKAYERQQLLFQAGATPRLAFEKSESEYKAAQDGYQSRQGVAKNAQDRIDSLNRELDAAKRDQTAKQQVLEEAADIASAQEMHSPVSGVVVGRKGEPGAEVTVAITDFFQVAANLEELEVRLDVPPAALQRIQAGLPAGVRVAEVADELAGTVREVRDGQAIVEFVSPSPAVRPGLTASVRLKLS